jgi:hypothetical protein
MATTTPLIFHLWLLGLPLGIPIYIVAIISALTLPIPLQLKVISLSAVCGALATMVMTKLLEDRNNVNARRMAT